MKNLKTLRKNKGLTLFALSEKLNISQQSLSCYELGQVSPPISTITKIADFFNCSTDYLLGHETKGIIHMDSYTPLQQEVISKLRLLDDDQLYMLSVYIDTINGKSLAELLDNAKNKTNKEN